MRGLPWEAARRVSSEGTTPAAPPPPPRAHVGKQVAAGSVREDFWHYTVILNLKKKKMHEGECSELSFIHRGDI